MVDVLKPAQMNQAFADAFNSRKIERLMTLYEDGAKLAVSLVGPALDGKEQIQSELINLLHAPGRMTSVNRFCIEHGDLALLRADWKLVADDGTLVASGSTAEVVRKQPEGNWLYIIDHAAAFSEEASS